MALLDGEEAPAPAEDPKFQKFMGNIARIESGDDYKAVNKDTGALGKYQIMPANVPTWSKEVLGKAITPEEFMANPALQEKIATTIMKGYVAKHGFEGAAQAWLGGEGSIGKVGRADANGTTVGAYGKRAMAGLDSVATPVSDDQPDVLRHYKDAHDSLDLTPQESELYLHHLDNLFNGKGYTHPDGSISTLFSETHGVGDKTYLIPRVHGGAIVSSDEAMKKAEEKGLDSHPSYKSPDEAAKRYELMHNFMDHDTEDYIKSKAPAVQRAAPVDRPEGLINMQ